MSPTEDVVEDESAKRRRFRRSDFLGNTDVEVEVNMMQRIIDASALSTHHSRLVPFYRILGD